MNAPGREDFLTWVVLICGIVLFLVLAYATVILWNAANPVPVVSEQKISKEQAVETAVEHFANVYRLSDTNGLEGSARVSAVPFLKNRVMWIVDLHIDLPNDIYDHRGGQVYVDAETGDIAHFNPCQ